MNPNDSPEDNSVPTDMARTQAIESNPGSGTPLHVGGVRCQLVTPPAIPDHELLRVIGHGAYGEVWLARNIMGTYRAVKIVLRDTFESDRPYEREFSGIQSFEPISRSHESQVDILHVGRNDTERYFYYVMELADDVQTGQQIAPDSYKPKTIHSELKRRGRFAHAETLEICLALTTAVEHLHKHGLIHRDIKPANVIFLNGLPKLADIGLVTETGGTMSFVGTEGYLPPEGPGSVQADIYSLGKTLYEVATGKDRMEFPELPTLTDSPAEEGGLFELNEVLLKACHPDPQKRYRTASEMHADLVLVLAGKSIRRSRALEQRLALLTKIAAGVLIVAALSAAAYVYQQFQTREARRLAQENQRLASKEATERQRAEDLLTEVQLQKTELQLKQAENFFENDDAGKGVAYLARMLRQDLSNHIAASRLMSALTDRSFPLPIRVFEHQDESRGSDFSPDGQRIVTWTGGDSNGTARIWNTLTGEILGKPMLHDKGIVAVQFSPDGRQIATLSDDGNGRIWDAGTGEALSAPLIQPGSTAYAGFSVLLLQRLGFSPDGKTLLTIGGTKARVWKVPSGELLIPPMDHGERLVDAEFSPDGQAIATSGDNSGDKTKEIVKIWEASTGKLRFALRLGDGSRGRARFSPDGRRLLTTGGFQAQIWDANSGKELVALEVYNLLSSACFSPDGVRVVTTYVNQEVRVWDSQSGRLLFSPLMHKAEVRDAQFDPTGERLLTREIRRARVWDSRTGRPLTEWLLHAKDIHSARFSPNGQNVLTTSDDNAAILWDIRPGQALNLALRHSAFVPSAKFSPDGKRVVTAAGDEIYIRRHYGHRYQAAVWDAYTGELVGPRIELPSPVQDAEFSPDGRRIVTASKNGQVRVWDVESGAPLTEPMTHSSSVRSACFSPDGKKVLTCSENTSIWDAQTGYLLTTFIGFSGEFSPDGRWVRTYSDSGNVRVWEVETGRERSLELSADKAKRLGGFNPANRIGRFSPDGQYIVLTSAVGTARVFNIETGKPVGEPLRHQNEILSIRFSPDGRYIVTASEDQSARIWEASTGRPMAEPLMHKGPVLSAEFSRDSRQVVTASTDKTARVWDVQTGRPLTDSLREGGWIASAEFSPDGRRVVVATAVYLARVRELTPSHSPFPKWLPDLAEAVAGERWTAQEISEPVSPMKYLALKSSFLKNTDATDHTQWVKWLIADRLTRNVSYTSPTTASTHLGKNGKGWLSEALHLSPENSVATAHLALQILKQDALRKPNKTNEAEFLSERALKLNPEDPEAWRARAEVLQQAGRREEALQAMDSAIRLKPDSDELWNLKGEWLQAANRTNDALHAYSRVVDLATATVKTQSVDAETSKTLTTALLHRAKLLKALNRHQESNADRLRALGIPARDPLSPTSLIDLSGHYNMSLLEELSGKADPIGKDNLASLPQGILSLAGVRFDLRGAVRIGSGTTNLTFPGADGILVNQKCRRLHFLHTWHGKPPAANDVNDVQIGRYLVRYDDGKEEEIPLLFEKTIAHWLEKNRGHADMERAWLEVNEAALFDGQLRQLFRLTWANPRPDVRITSIEFDGRQTNGATGNRRIILVAISAQNEPIPSIMRNPHSQTVSQGQEVLLKVQAESEAPLRYQWQFNGANVPGATNAELSFKAVTREAAGSYTVEVRNALEDSTLTLTSKPASLVVQDDGLNYGALKREMFTNINGLKLSDLTNHTRFPSSPDTVDFVHQFETPSNIAENYGVRLTGSLVPPKTGEYRFYLCSDDEGALFLSTSESPEQKRQVAYEPTGYGTGNPDRLWTIRHSRPKQQNISEPIHLEVGRRYYVEALMKEGQGGDNLAVTWQMPGDPPPENLSPPIPGTYLAVPAEWINGD